MEDMDIDEVVIPDTPPDRFAARHAIRREPVEGNSVNGITLNDRFNSELGGRRLVIRPPRNPGNISTKNGRHSYVLSSGDNSSASQNAHLFRRPGMGKTSRSDAKYSSGTESMDRRESISNRVLSKSSAFPEDTEILDITEQNGHTQLRRKDFPDGKLEDVAEGRRNRQISSVSSSKDCIANRMERSRNANKGKEIDDRTLNRLDSAGSLGEGIDLSTEPQHKTGNHKTMGSHSFTLPRVSGQKRLVRNGCISPHNIAMKSKQLYEEPNNSSKNIEQSHAVNAVSSGSPYVIDVNDITVDDNKRERMKGKGVMVQSSSPKESNARVGHTLTSFVNDNNEANRTSYADKDISGCFGKEGGWRSTRNRSSTLDPFLSDSLAQRPRVNSGAGNLVFQHGKRVEREDIGREGNFVNLANGLNSTQTASSLVSEPGRMAGQRHEGNRVINREKKRGSSMEIHGECSTLNNGDSEILFLGSSQASESSKPSRMQRRPVIEVDELSPAAGPSAPQDANSRNDDSEARARQLEADEMLARDLQEQLYHEVPVFGGEIDEHLAWALQHEENASNTSSSSTPANWNMEEDWDIVHIPAKPPFLPDQQPTVDVIAASLLDPKFANTLVRRLTQIGQLENLRHVKRVKKKYFEGGKAQLSVILCLASENGLDNIPHDIRELINLYQLNPFITKVCKYAALSKEEWAEQSKLWPTSYHPPTYNIDGISGFNEEDSQSVLGFMKYVIQLAKSVDYMEVNAAVIVDPSNKKVIATACDQTLSLYKPVDKITLEAYKNPEDSISRSELDEVLNNETPYTNRVAMKSKQLYAGVSCLYPWRWAEQQIDTCCSFHPLRHAAVVAIESSAARDIQLFPGLGNIDDGMVNAQSFPASSPAKQQKTHSTIVEDKANLNTRDEGSISSSRRPYLCTGFDIFLAWEPCIMCAMALVHQRIRRIFFAFPNPNAGALGTVHRLQGEKSLNHHYAVFRVVAPDHVLCRDEASVAEHN